ncbi:MULTISPECIES: polymer-forming cytoskeletal protein [unclassified Duganella]|uniref:bactofilin family protein n=1 Tax=unclassified Duganella TaxID=2636909 RepID=UPI000E34DCBD|nr:MULTISPECIES: polymer-forming cytoskeletal protein [unclassified Duganella]RFP10682.1 polymer-forming cytoskeletal family protein [Duganella sp. BJB475]RFP27291.1 polymer-forming cytoskeletal family protein [Duganella sp. BJB476]
MIDMDSLIGAATRVQGDLLFRGGMRIDGEVIGNIVAEAGYPSYLVIAEHARVEGEIRCDHLVVNGEVQGCVFSADLLEIQPSARIIGDVSYKVLEMHGGAQVLGTLTHRDSSGVGPLLAVSGA